MTPRQQLTLSCAIGLAEARLGKGAWQRMPEAERNVWRASFYSSHDAAGSPAARRSEGNGGSVGPVTRGTQGSCLGASGERATIGEGRDGNFSRWAMLVTDAFEQPSSRPISLVAVPVPHSRRSPKILVSVQNFEFITQFLENRCLQLYVEAVGLAYQHGARL